MSTKNSQHQLLQWLGSKGFKESVTSLQWASQPATALPDETQQLLSYSNSCTSQVMFLQAFSWVAFLSGNRGTAVPCHAQSLMEGLCCPHPQHPCDSAKCGVYTTETVTCPNFLHLLWSFQLLGDTHLHTTVQPISCFSGCILQFFSDGSPSDILWQLISKVGHEFKKYVIWAPLAINCLYARLVC